MGNLSNNTSGLQKILEAVEGLNGTKNTKTVTINWSGVDEVSYVGFNDADGVWQKRTSSDTVEALGGIVYCYFGTGLNFSLSGNYTKNTSSLYCLHSDDCVITVTQSDEPL